MSDGIVCAKCGSARVVPRVRVRDVGDYGVAGKLSLMLYENPDAVFFKETFHHRPDAASAARAATRSCSPSNPAISTRPTRGRCNRATELRSNGSFRRSRP